jgi:hypothetical protein
MEELRKKLEMLVKAVKAAKQKPAGYSLPAIPSIKPPPPPSMKSGGKETKLPAPAPNSKKDPRKIAQQIKDGVMTNKTQRALLKFDQNGQWTLQDPGQEKVRHVKVEGINPQFKADKFEDNKR